jgi:hypothetical protein
MAGFDPRTPYQSAFLYESSRLYDGFRYPGPNNSPWTVEVGFDLAANGVGDWFTLDDPIKGELDNVTYLLAGEVLVDVTRWVRRIAVKRGRSRQLEKFITGACEVVFDNRDRLFDPTMEGSPFFGSIVPRKQVRIRYENFPVFAGNTQDWDFDYEPNGDSTATVKGLDGFAYLATQTVSQQTMTAELSGDRVNHVLDGLGWPATQRSIDGGSASLTPDVVGANTNALSYLQKVEVSQNGLFFITRDGAIRFEDDYNGNPTPYVLGQNGIRFVDYEVIYGAEELWNRLNITYHTSGSVTATYTDEDAVSQTAYGVFESSYDTFLSGSAQAASLATNLLSQYAQPRYRVNRVVFDLQGLDTNSKTDVLSMEMGDRVLVTYRPSDVGEPLNRTCLIDAIEHDVTPSRHFVTMALTDLGA